ncbi:TadE family type IV pilus minor pilin [Microlunatus sp. GCM10028923]|uniref:TadE family type IV pilus minor pilin n=1 Tax=Microlunatus sp. GCM10028923 TaxID=3273400 RepID=UPI00360CBE52
MVTAELAVSILAALALLSLLSWGIGLIVLQLQCGDTAAEVARQAARGDETGIARAKQDAPDDAVIMIDRSGNTTIVTVRLEARPLSALVPAVPLTASAEVVTEPGESG